MSSRVEKGDGSPFSCRSCFPVGERILGCAECMRCLRRGGLSPAAQLHGRLGCEHMIPDELKGLTLVEEKLIALNSCYGFVTRYSIPGGQRQSLRYPRHVKGHIMVCRRRRRYKKQDATVSDESGEPYIHGAASIASRSHCPSSSVPERVHEQ
ncbi:hypothetical protein EDB80DRAFT_175476 [Ilyonectria destructans]|nr:hypothetical protein EDB80DRAFT_239466 [Ilyonectria destructans]KAH6988759.1 hypothetical protein EDB80DRAFT_175476 [Ilyonectria destructans]